MISRGAMEAPRRARGRYVDRSLRFLLPLLLVPCIASAQSSSPILSYPTELYAGLNTITLASRNGLRSVEILQGGAFTLFRTGLETAYYRVISGPSFARCALRTTFTVYVKTLTRPVSLRLRVVDCNDNVRYLTYGLGATWQVTSEDFGVMRVGERRCRTFSVLTRGSVITIDSITSPSPDFKVIITGDPPPLRVGGFLTYRYDVCHVARRPGLTRVPILVYLRRDQPAGRYTNFIVADTAVVNVLPAPPPARPKVVPRPRPVPPPPKDTIVRRPEVAAAPLLPLPVQIASAVPAPAGPVGAIPIEPDRRVIDPTTHRVILLPTARPIDRDRVVLANYDVAGWLIGVGATERLTLLGGLLYVPRSISPVVAATAGMKYEWLEDGLLRSAAGMHLNFVQTKLSVVRLLFVYNAVSYGDDDSRGTLSLGYTWRSHSPVGGTTYSRRALAVGLGADHRFAQHWKVAAELTLVEAAERQPAEVVVRYFDDRFAIDVGIGAAIGLHAGDGSPVIPLPVASFSWAW